MERSADHAAHNLRSGVVSSISVGSTVDNECQAIAIRYGDAAFDAVDLPRNLTPNSLHELAHFIGRSPKLVDAAHPDLTVTPKCGRPCCSQHQKGERCHRQRRNESEPRGYSAPGETCGHDGEYRKEDDDDSPHSRC